MTAGDRILLEIFPEVMIANVESPDKVEMRTVDRGLYQAHEELSGVHPVGTANFGVGQCAFLIHECLRTLELNYQAFIPTTSRFYAIYMNF